MFYVTNFEREADKFDERYGMKKIHDFIRDITKDQKPSPVCKCKCEENLKDVNIGYTTDKVIFEVALPGVKKENITVTYNGNVIIINATYITDDNINYVVKNIKHENVSKKFRLEDKFLGGNIKWKFTDGLLVIAVESDDVSTNISASNDDEDIIGSNNQTTNPTENMP